jgi:hypothetical protein
MAFAAAAYLALRPAAFRIVWPHRAVGPERSAAA